MTKTNPQQDIEDFLAKSFRNWTKRQPRKNLIVVTAQDVHERNDMQSMRESFGYTGTAYFDPSEVFDL